MQNIRRGDLSNAIDAIMQMVGRAADYATSADRNMRQGAQIILRVGVPAELNKLRAHARSSNVIRFPARR